MATDRSFAAITGSVCIVAGCLSMSLAYLDAASERDRLRAAWRATVRAQGEGSCAVADGGPKVVCWMEGGTVRRLELGPHDRVLAPKPKRRRAT